MGQILHRCARTTEALRRTIQYIVLPIRIGRVIVLDDIRYIITSQGS
jgi:hypothetical protein